MTEDEKHLDELFAAARQQRPDLSDDLVVRIQTDAETMRLATLACKPQPNPSVWTRLVRGLGGWQGLGGLVTASVVGVWIGFAAPGFLPDPANYFFDPVTSIALADLDASYLEDAE